MERRLKEGAKERSEGRTRRKEVKEEDEERQ
jgi:hypothetical protein